MDKTREMLEFDSLYQAKTIINRYEVETEGSRTKIKNKELVSENTIYIDQLQELVKLFSSIENYQIRGYAINLIREIGKCEDEEKAKKYISEMLENQRNDNDKQYE